MVIRVNYKKTVILITFQKSFLVKHIVLIFSLISTAFFAIYKNIDKLLAWHIKFGNRKTFKKELNEELIPVALHPKRCWNFYRSEDEKKEKENIFTE